MPYRSASQPVAASSASAAAVAQGRSSPEPTLVPGRASGYKNWQKSTYDYEMGSLSSGQHAPHDEEMRMSAEELMGEQQGHRGQRANGQIPAEGAQAELRSRASSSLWSEHAQATTSSTLASKGQQLFGLNLADAAVVRHLAINAMLIGLWYFFSLSISLYNQWMFSGDHLNFKFPLFTTCMHMLVQFFLASVVLYFVPRLRPSRGRVSSSVRTTASSSSSPSTSRRGSFFASSYKDQEGSGVMSRWFYITRIGPSGAATGLDIGLGNTSMRFITLTFYTMCKSSVLGFVLLFAFLFGLERPSIKLLGIIAVMTVGVVLMVAGETKFNLTGFLLIMSAAAFSGFRWALTQILLLRNPATSNPFSSLFFLAPIMFITLLAVAVPAEGIYEVAAGLGELTSKLGSVQAVLLLLFPGTLAFCMTASEFALLKRTSVVTLSVCGIFKEVVTIITAQSTLDHDRMTVINLTGLAVTIASIATYNYIKIRKMRAEAEAELLGGSDGSGGFASKATAGGGSVRYQPVGSGEEQAEERERQEADDGYGHGQRIHHVLGSDDEDDEDEEHQDQNLNDRRGRGGGTAGRQY